MYIFEDFGLYIIFLILFSILYFLIERLLSLSIILKITKAKYIEDIIRGGVFGVATVLIQYINKSLNGDFVLPLTVICGILLFLLRNIWTSLFSFIPGSLHYIFSYDSGFSLYVITAFFSFSIISIILINFFALKNQRMLILFLTFTGIVAAAFAVSIFSPINDSLEYSIRIYIEIYIFILISYPLLQYSINFSISSGVLYKSNRYTHGDFHRPQLSTSVISEFIYKKQINKGYLVIVNIKVDDDIPNSKKDLVIKRVEEELAEKLKKENIIYFTAINQNVGFFYPIEFKYPNYREDTLELIKLKNAINFQDNKIVYDNEKLPVNISINAGISIYGIDNSSIDELKIYSEYALERRYHDGVVFFDSKKYLSSIKENIKFSDMDKRLSLDDFAIEYIPINYAKRRGVFAQYANVQNISENQYYEDVDKIIYSTGWEQLFTRYYGAEAAMSGKNQRVVFDYDISILSDVYTPRKFLHYLSKNKIKSKNIILYIKKYGMAKKRLNMQNIKNNINELSKHNIKFLIDHEIASNWLFSDLKISQRMIAYNAEDINNDTIITTSENVLVNNINNDIHLRIAKKIGARYLGGKLFK